MSNANTVSGGQHRLSFGDGAVLDLVGSDRSHSEFCAHAYTIPNHSGWLVFTRFNSCRAQLRSADGWTQEQAEVVARVLDGEVVL